MAVLAGRIPRRWLSALLRELGRRPYWSSRRHSLRDVVVRVLLRRRPSTPLPAKNQLPLADHVYCYGPLDPDDPDSASGWHWAPRKDYFDRSADATLEYYAPMSSSASVNELPRSRRSSVSTGRPGSRASGAARDSSGARALDAGELADRLKQYQQDEMLWSARDMLVSGAVGCEGATSGFCSPPVPSAGAPNGLIAFAVNVPYPSEYDSPTRLPIPSRKTPLKSILKTPKMPASVPLPVSPPSPVRLTPVYPPLIPSPQLPVQMANLPLPLIPLAQSPPLPFIPPHFAYPGPASLISSSQSSPAVEHPIIPPFSEYYPDAPFSCPSPPHVIQSPQAPLLAHPVHPAPSPPFPFPAHEPPPPPIYPFPYPSPAASPPQPPPTFSPAPPLAPSAPRHYPPGYAAGVSSLLSAPGELVFSFLSSPPHALLRRRLNHRVAVPLSDASLGESAFYPAERDVLLVMPQLPWAVALKGEGWLSVGDVLAGLREHLGRGVRPAEREMLRVAEHDFGVRARGDALGARSWLLGIWEDPDAVRRVMGPGQDVQFVRGRRCFVVLFGSEEETMC